MTTMLVLFGVFVLLQALDFYSTVKALEKPNTYEANPLLKFVMDRIGMVPALIIFKSAVIAIVGYFLIDIPVPVLAVIDLAYMYVVYRNFNLS